MEQVTKETWLNALLPIHNGGRLNQLLSVMTGGNIQYIDWLINMGIDTMHAAQQAEIMQQVLADAQVESQFVVPATPWQGAGILHTSDGETGLMVIAAYAAIEDFHQEELQAQLQWLQQMQHLNHFPVRMLLLAFSKVPDPVEYEQPDMLNTWEWEELLETGMHMAIGQQADLAEVMILPMVAYPAWLGQ
ncbi:MAG: hypothetical protein IJO07_02530 [Peptococcaceae bacterium]|nr:hypothetical protein [Peptococcaceae bacterium]